MGEVVIEVKAPGEGEPDFVAIPFPEGNTEGAFSNGARELDERFKGRLQRLADSGELKGELGTTVVLHTDGELKARRVVVAGIGKKEEVDADALRTAASAVALRVADVGGTLAWLLDDSLPLPLAVQARAIVEGTMLGSYSPARWKTQEKPAARVEKIVLYTTAGNGLAESASRIATVGKWVNFARDLANSPPNELTPEALAMRAAELAGPTLAVEALDSARIDELGMGTNSKLHVQFTSRLWNSLGNQGETYADTGYQNTWEVSRAQGGGVGKGLLVDYTGGNIGASFGSGTPSSRAQQFMSQMQPLFPGTKVADHWTGRATIDFWTGYQWTKGSYSYWKVGQYTKFSGMEYARQGNCHFCGEHTSQDFQGYLNGAVETGERVVGDILGDLKHA